MISAQPTATVAPVDDHPAAARASRPLLQVVDAVALERSPARRLDARWPRNVALSGLLGLALFMAFASPCLDDQWPVGQLAAVVGMGALGAFVARLAFVIERPPTWSPGPASDLRRALVAAAIGAVLTGSGLLSVGVEFDLRWFATAWAAGSAVLLGAAATGRLEARARTRARRVFLLGTEAQHLDLAREIRGRSDMDLAGFAGVRLHNEGAEFRAAIDRSGATLLLLSDEAIRDDNLVALAGELNLRGLRVRELRGFYEREFEKVAVSELSPSWFLFDVAEIHRDRVYGRLKRVIELVISLAGLMLALPLFPLVALAVKASSPGSVLFAQERVGKGGRRFRLTKFRTMHGTESREDVWADACGSRIFPVGRVLRRFRLDELPQLWHVVRGDMSLVGPRPEQPAIAARLEHSMPFYAARHCVRPGLTGWAQVNFGYGGSDEGALTKLQYDLYYVKRQGILFDLRIIAATLRVLLRGLGE